jgi:hypothetical protein
VHGFQDQGGVERAVRQNAEADRDESRADQSGDEHSRLHGASSPGRALSRMRVLAMLSREVLAL